MSEKNSKDFEGYRLVLFDCKEGKIVMDELITALMGGYVKVVDESEGKYDAMSLVITRCLNRHAISCSEAAEAALREFKKKALEEMSPGTMDKIKEMAKDICKKMFGGNKEE